MTSFERFENRLPTMLDELAVPRLPDYADDLFARTAATRQRPGWSFPERWLPMSALSRRLAAVPPVPWRIGVAVALLVVAAIIAVIVAGSHVTRVPAPFGPAGNGRIAFIDDSGRIVLGDVNTSATQLVADVTGASTLLVSLDGTRVAFLRESASLAGMYDLMAANADGSNLKQLATEQVAQPSYVGWSANGGHILVVDRAGNMLLFGTDQAGPPTDLSKLAGIGAVQVGDGFGFRSDAAFRPPNGDEILFTSQGMNLMAIRTDGTVVRTILDGKAAGFSEGVKGAKWSPDGSEVLFLARTVISPDLETWHAYVVNGDGTGLHPLSGLSTNRLADQNGMLWSPDGTRVAFLYWLNPPDSADFSGAIFHAITVVDVHTGAQHEVGPIRQNGWVSIEWSPDGASILGVPSDDSGGNICGPIVCVPANAGPGDVLIINATTGAATTAPWQVQYPISWQRVAPR